MIAMRVGTQTRRVDVGVGEPQASFGQRVDVRRVDPATVTAVASTSPMPRSSARMKTMLGLAASAKATFADHRARKAIDRLDLVFTVLLFLFVRPGNHIVGVLQLAHFRGRETRQGFRRPCNSESLGDFRYGPNLNSQS